AYVTRGLQVLRTPGAAVAVVKDGRVLFARGYGVRTLGDTARVDAHTLFQIASNTKAFTTAALAILADDGKLSWDDPVTRFLPGFQLYDPYVTREFTVRDLVTHRSGLGLGAGDLLWFHSSYGREEIAHRIRFAKPVSSFRSQYAYDNVLYIVAGEVVRAVASRTWDDFVKERIFVPLGMTETGTTTAAFTGSGNAATPHGVDNGKLQVVPIDSADNIAPGRDRFQRDRPGEMGAVPARLGALCRRPAVQRAPGPGDVGGPDHPADRGPAAAARRAAARLLRVRAGLAAARLPGPEAGFPHRRSRGHDVADHARPRRAARHRRPHERRVGPDGGAHVPPARRIFRGRGPAHGLDSGVHRGGPPGSGPRGLDPG